MRHSRSHRIFVVVLVLVRLMLGDLVHLPAAQASTPEAPRPMMMGGEPCSGMAGSLAHTDHHSPLHDGTCCKSSQCPCLHAPALTPAPPMPLMFGISFAEVPSTKVFGISEPPSVFFRPPIPALR